MKWGHSHLLVLLAALPLGLAVFYALTQRHKKKLLERFCGPALLPVVLPNFSRARQTVKMVMLVLGLTLVMAALCRPQLGFHWEEVKRKGVDILVAMDVSSSMLAQDVSPNRLERSRREVIDLLRILKGDRVGLIAFAGVPYLQCPLTLDYGAIQIFLDYLSPDLIPVPGTAIAAAIELATTTFQKQAASKEKALILITDGEDHGGDPLRAAKAAKEAGIRIFTIGIGQEGGAPIPSEDGGGFRKDRDGNLILSKIDEETLKKIALETGGMYVRSTTGDIDLQRIYDEQIRGTMEQVELQSGKRRHWEERFQWPLALGVLLILLEPLVPETRRRSRKAVDEERLAA